MGEPEYFSAYPRELDVDRMTNTIVSIKDGDHSAYGNVDIKASNGAMIYEWTLKLENNYNNTIYIGIDSSGKKHLYGEFFLERQNDSDFYAFCDDYTYDKVN